MDKGSLEGILKSVDKIIEAIVGYIAYHILLGLNYLHKELKLIHRDIKPANILINSRGDVKIADLGICGKLDHTMDVTNSWVGTLVYMGPERLNEMSYSFTSDIWSLGLTLLECMIGKSPLALD